MLFPDHFWNAPQMTETAWQGTSKYESSVHSPPQTTICSCQRTGNYKTHLKPHCRLPCNVQLEQESGKGTLGEGRPEKQSEGGKTT